MAIPFENNSTSSAPNPANGVVGAHNATSNIVENNQNNNIDVPDHPELPFNNQPPSDAIVVGSDFDGNTIYLGQVIYSDGIYRNKLPAFITPTKQQIDVFHNGNRVQSAFFIYQKHSHSDYHLSWSPHHSNAELKHNAFPAGVMETANGWENIYVGRIFLHGILFLGRVTADQSFLLIFNGSYEVAVRSGFEILVIKKGICAEIVDTLCQCCIT